MLFFAAYWYVLVTMTTVGYGDLYPIDVGGKLSAVLVIIVGYVVTALPIAIIGGNFALVHEYNMKRNREKAKSDNTKYEKSGSLTSVHPENAKLDNAKDGKSLSVVSLHADKAEIVDKK